MSSFQGFPRYNMTISEVGLSLFFLFPQLEILMKSDCFLSSDLRFSSRALSLQYRKVLEAANSAIITTKMVTIVIFSVIAVERNKEKKIIETRCNNINSLKTKTHAII